MFRLNYSSLLFVLLSFLYSDFVSIDNAKKIANNIMFSNYSYDNDLEVESIHHIKEGSNTLIYVINYFDKGFVLVSADDRVMPLLGYSFNNNYSDNNLPIQLEDMIIFSTHIKYDNFRRPFSFQRYFTFQHIKCNHMIKI